MKNQTALVTGASGGIGKAIAEQFAKDGYDLVISARNLTQLQALADSWQQTYKVKVVAVAADLSQPQAAQELYAEVKRQQIVITYLVNNAGYGLFGLFDKLDHAQQMAMLQLNIMSLTSLAKLFLPDLITQRGRMMNVASTAAFQPGPLMAAYYASKAYVLSLSEALAEELSDQGVSVTAFCPGPTLSGFQDKASMHDSGLVKGKKLPGSEEVGLAGYHAMMAGKRVYIPGFMNWLMAQSVRFSPRSMVTKLVKLISLPV